MKYIRVLASVMATFYAASLYAGEAVFLIMQDGKAAKDTFLVIDGVKQPASKNGYIVVDMKAGDHKVQLLHNNIELKSFVLPINAQANTEIKLVVTGSNTEHTVTEYLPGSDVTGTITGSVSSSENGKKLAAARVAVVGKPLETITDNNGKFVLPVPPGAYDLAITHPKYGKKVSKNVRVISDFANNLDVSLVLAGSTGTELVATGEYVEDAVETKRDAVSIMDSIGTEEIAKAGDSDAGAAVKRVSGVSLVGGQYAIVRGLGGRYISSSLNNGTIPSTNPLSRDVALDLFPASALQGIEIQKSFTPDLPGDSTGGSINMVTKGMPEERIAKLTLGTGLRTGVTGKDVITYEGGDTDYLGIDDGTREMPDLLNAVTHYGQNSYSVCSDTSACISQAQAARLANSLENIYNTDTVKAIPDLDLGLSYGDLVEAGNGEFGYYGDVNYKSKWGARQDAEIHDDSGDFKYERSKRNIDISAYGVLGYQDAEGNLELLSKTMMLRKTDDTTREANGTDNEGTPISDVTLQWVERSYIGQSFSGKHLFVDQEHELDWRFTGGQSVLYEPDRRTYQYRAYQIFPSTLERRYSEQVEDSMDFAVDYTFNWQLNDSVSGKLKAGVLAVEKSRETKLGRFGIVQGPGAVTAGLDLESLLVPDNFNNGNYTLLVRTTATDSYDAEDDMLAYYLNTETDINSQWIVTAGIRVEDAIQKLRYFYAPASNDRYETDEILPAIGLTWKMTDQWQLRASYSQTVSRPGLTERSLSSQYDPETDEQVFGNNQLEISNIDNLDFRAEYYFDDVDSVSVGVFTKLIDSPIERTVPDASGSAANGYTFINQDEATVYGIEFDIRKTVLDTGSFNGYVSSNLSWIDSEVTLQGRSLVLEGGDSSRELQGQSDVLANLQFGLDHLPTLQTVTFMVNYFSDRISKVGRAGRNEIEEGRPTVDVVYKYEIYPELTFGAKIQNLFDQKIKYTIFDDVSESWHEGTYFTAGMTYAF